MSLLNNREYTLLLRRHGVEANLLLATIFLVRGELAYCTDTGRIYVGDLLDGTAKRMVAKGFPCTFANLPASPSVGDLHDVTDSTTAVWGAIIAGTGGNSVLARWNGANWTVVGK